MLWVELIILFQPKLNINMSKKLRTGKVKYENFSAAEIPRLTITYLIETSLITVEASCKPFLALLRSFGSK